MPFKKGWISRSLTRFLCWSKKNGNYTRSRKISDYRATSLAQKLVCTGALQGSKFNGCPLVKEGK